MHFRTAAQAVIGVLCLWTAGACADERLWVDAKINGRPAHLCFDTGTRDLVLFTAGAKRLDVTYMAPPTNTVLLPGEVRTGVSEVCDLTVNKTSLKTQFIVADIPEYLRADIDGVIGWKAIRGNILKIDAERGTVNALAELPGSVRKWLQVPIDKQSGFLQLEVPLNAGGRGSIFVDTGWTQGVGLTPEGWRDWKAAHPLQPLTVKSYFMPGVGVLVKQEAWAARAALGPIQLTDVPITEAPPVHISLAVPPFAGSLGMAGLKRMDLIVDGINSVAYVRPKNSKPRPYEHNRLGAVFVPRSEDNHDLVAQVVPGSPAEEAGLRNGDVLLRVGDLDATQWRSNPKVLPLSRFWEQPPGTKLILTLQRAGKEFVANPILRQVVPPAPAKR
jgi:hypothetical protein